MPYAVRPFGPVAIMSSGGFALFANGTGTASFDHFCVKQFPDPALSLAPVLPRLGSSSVSYNAVIPAKTTAVVKTGTDGVNWTTATSGQPLPGFNSQPAPTIDVFTANTSANYTNTNKSGGSAATATYDTANKRITLAGGSGGLYLYTAISATGIDVICDMDRSDAGGLVWRMVDSSNYYELGCYDDSASGGFTNQLRLYKVLAGTRSLLGSASIIAWPRSTVGASPYKRIRVTMLGSVITVYFDGAVMQTYTDGSPLAAGKCGFRNDGGTSRYYQLRIQQQGDYVSGTPAGDVVTADFVYTQVTLTTTDPSVTPQLLDLTTSARSPQIATGALIPQLHDPTKPFALGYDKEMTSLATLSGDTWYHVGYDNALTFAERFAAPAPFCLYSSDFLYRPATQGAATGGVQPTSSADTYRNQEIVTNTVGITGTIPEEKVADGIATSWSMQYPLYSAPKIMVAGVAKTVGLQGIDVGKDFYWQVNSVSIGQDSGAAKIPSGYIISFSYVGQFPDQVIRNNLAEQAARAAIEGGTGIVVSIDDGQGMLSSNAIVYADGLLARNSNNDTVELVATTSRPDAYKLTVGMVVPVFVPELNLNNRQLLIMKLTRSGYQRADGTVQYEYTIDATDGSNLQNWAAAIGL